MDDVDIEAMTLQHFPEPIIRDLVRAVFTARRDAWVRCRDEFAPPEAENIRPIETRGRLEGLMRAVAERHQISATVERQEGQPWNHTELTSGPVVITAATVQTPLEMVDPADYRLTLAGSPQARFEFFDDPTPSDARLYALLLHSRSHFPSTEEQRDYGFLPGSVYIAYPNAAFDHYVHWINLFLKFPEVVETMTPDEWDDQTRHLYIERSRTLYSRRRRIG